MMKRWRDLESGKSFLSSLNQEQTVPQRIQNQNHLSKFDDYIG